MTSGTAFGARSARHAAGWLVSRTEEHTMRDAPGDYLAIDNQQAAAQAARHGGSSVSARRELEQIIARLDVMPQVPAMNYDPSGGGGGDIKEIARLDERGGNQPKGGISRQDDKDRESNVVKSADHYRRRLALARTERDVERALAAARETLRTWTHTPVPTEPEYGTPMWKRWIADSKESNADLARRFNCSREYIRQVRAQEGVIDDYRRTA